MEKTGCRMLGDQPKVRARMTSCLLFSCPVTVPFLSPESPARTVPSGLRRLHQLIHNDVRSPAPQHIFYFSLRIFTSFKDFSK